MAIGFYARPLLGQSGCSSAAVASQRQWGLSSRWPAATGSSDPDRTACKCRTCQAFYASTGGPDLCLILQRLIVQCNLQDGGDRAQPIVAPLSVHEGSEWLAGATDSVQNVA